MPPTILLVESNPDDLELTKRAFQRARIANDLVVARDGDEALALLFQEGNQTEALQQLPHLVLLNTRLPTIGGLDVLNRIRAAERTKGLRVVVITSSAHETEELRRVRSPADDFLEKPIEPKRLIGAANNAGLRWFVMNENAAECDGNGPLRRLGQ